MSLTPLNSDLDVVQSLVIPGLDSDLDIIQKLDDEPNDVGGLTAAQLKAKFDESGNTIKTYLNDTLLPALSGTVAEEEARAAAETQRQTNESARVSAESARASAEGLRVTAESARATQEGARADAEAARSAAETARGSAESTRSAQESSRVSAEAGRVSAESARSVAEQARARAETERVSEFSALKAQSESATAAANTAAGKVNNMTVQASTGAAGSSASVTRGTNAQGGIELTFQIPQGPQGPAGSGSGDMISSIYDPQGKAQDVFAYADGKNVLYVTVSEPTTPTGSYTADHSCSEIMEAVEAGRPVFAVYELSNNRFIYLPFTFSYTGASGRYALFSTDQGSSMVNVIIAEDGAVTYQEIDLTPQTIGALPTSGGTITGDVSVSAQDDVDFATMDFGYRKDGVSVFQPSTLRGIQIPTEPDMAASKEFVDAAVAGAGIPVVTTAGTGAAYTATVEGITELTAGQMLVIIPHTSSTSQAVTLNVNNLGAKNIWRYTSKSSGQISNGYNTQWIASDIPLMLVYDSAHQCWFSISLSKPYAYDLDGILNVLKGGTGQESLTSGSYLVGNGTSAVQLKTPAQVREDIGAAGKPKTLQISIPASGWDASAKTQTVTATGVTATNAVTPSPAPASWEAAGTAGVRCTAQAADSLTFTCSEVPTADLTYNVLVQEVQ